MNSGLFDFDQRVVLLATESARENGTAGWHGKIVGMSREGDEPSGRVLAYGVAMDEDDNRVWMFEPGDLQAD